MDNKKIQDLIDKQKNKSRKHADLFEWHDKDTKELVIVQDFLQKLKEVTGEYYAEPEKVKDDPPDFMVKNSKGEYIGIEITELVDEDAIKYDIKGSTYEYLERITNWDKDVTIEKLTEIISTKDQKCSYIRNSYKSMVLLIFTDEPMLRPDILDQYINNHDWDRKGFDKVYILVGFEPKSGRKCLIPLK